MVSLDVTVGRTKQQGMEDDARGRERERERKRETGWIGYSMRLAVIFMY